MNGFFRFCCYSKIALIPPIPPILLIPPNLFISPILIIPLIQLSIVSNKLLQLPIIYYNLQYIVCCILMLSYMFRL